MSPHRESHLLASQQEVIPDEKEKALVIGTAFKVAEGDTRGLVAAEMRLDYLPLRRSRVPVTEHGKLDFFAPGIVTAMELHGRMEAGENRPTV